MLEPAYHWSVPRVTVIGIGILGMRKYTAILNGGSWYIKNWVVYTLAMACWYFIVSTLLNFLLQLAPPPWIIFYLCYFSCADGFSQFTYRVYHKPLTCGCRCYKVARSGIYNGYNCAIDNHNAINHPGYNKQCLLYGHPKYVWGWPKMCANGSLSVYFYKNCGLNVVIYVLLLCIH